MERSGDVRDSDGERRPRSVTPRHRDGDHREVQLEGFRVGRLLGRVCSRRVHLRRVGGSEALDYAVASSSTGRTVVGTKNRIIGASDDENQNGKNQRAGNGLEGPAKGGRHDEIVLFVYLD